jgi:hypothetical protein
MSPQHDTAALIDGWLNGQGSRLGVRVPVTKRGRAARIPATAAMEPISEINPRHSFFHVPISFPIAEWIY